jgi:hypothetical protein
MTLHTLLTACALAVCAAALFWLVCRLLLAAGTVLRRPGAFAGEALNTSGERVRMALHGSRRKLLVLTVSGAYAPVTAALLLALPWRPPEGLPAYAAWGIAALLLVAWVFFLLRGLTAARALRFSARAHAALGNAFERLAGQGHRTFHDVWLGNSFLDHVVVGKRGLFVIQVAARRPPKGAEAVRLHNRHLQYQDGVSTVEPVLRAERGARDLATQAGRWLGHRISIRAAVAAPGWKAMPVKSGDILLLNEKNAVMLPGWSRPADHLLDEDVQALQERFVALCANEAL